MKTFQEHQPFTNRHIYRINVYMCKNVINIRKSSFESHLKRVKKQRSRKTSDIPQSRMKLDKRIVDTTNKNAYSHRHTNTQTHTHKSTERELERDRKPQRCNEEMNVERV